MMLTLHMNLLEELEMSYLDLSISPPSSGGSDQLQHLILMFIESQNCLVKEESLKVI